MPDIKMKELTVDSSGERLDVFLSKRFKDYSRSYFQRLIKSGSVTVNGKEVVPHFEPKPGDTVSIDFVTEQKNIGCEDLPIEIIYEDKDVLVLNKEPGMVVHPACGHPTGTLLNALLGYSKGKFSPFLVHRLDKDTSGVMLVAKNEKAKNSLVKQFQNRKVKKVYLAAVKGMVNEDRGRIEAPLGRSLKDRKKIEVGATANKDAVTEFKVLSRNRVFSLLEVYPHTGRTHQIRSHMAYIGHPVLGDKTYGGPEKIEGRILGRQMLHAFKISFTHPEKHKIVEYSAEPAKDFRIFLKDMER